MEAIRIFSEDSREYKLLKAAAEIMTAFSPKGFAYWVDTVYFDYGAGKLWTTVLGYTKGERYESVYQAVYPALQKEIISATSISELGKTIEKYFTREHCLDKKTA